MNCLAEYALLILLIMLAGSRILEPIGSEINAEFLHTGERLIATITHR